MGLPAHITHAGAGAGVSRLHLSQPTSLTGSARDGQEINTSPCSKKLEVVHETEPILSCFVQLKFEQAQIEFGKIDQHGVWQKLCA